MQQLIQFTRLMPGDFVALTPSQRHAYAQCLEPSHACCLEGKDPWAISSAEIYGIAAHDTEANLLGLALATYRRYGSFAKLLELRLTHSLDTSNIAMAAYLLQQLEELLRQQNCRVITYLMHGNSPLLETLFRQSGWSVPRLSIVKCDFKTHSFKPTWLKKVLAQALPNGFELFPWTALTAPENKQLKHLQAEDAFPLYVSPFHDEHLIEPLNSLGLRYQGVVVGWMITNRVDATTIRYESLYIDKRYRYSSLPGRMLATSISLQLDSDIENGILEMNLDQVDQRWLNFVKRRLLPSAVNVERLYSIYHQLIDPDPEDQDQLDEE